MAKHKIGFGFCSYVAPGENTPADYDVGPDRLMLGSSSRIEGFRLSFSAEVALIETLILMGTAHEVNTYRKILIDQGVSESHVKSMVTSQTTIGNAQDVWQYVHENKISADNHCLITSDYHERRAVETAESFNNFKIKHSYGTESIRLQAALKRGGIEELNREREKMEAEINPTDFLKRTLFEKQGTTQILFAPETYKPKK